jgi:thiamine biosynthesis protein ThiS
VSARDGAILAAVHVEVNGERRMLADDATVVMLLEALGLGSTLVAVERNGEIVPRAQHASTRLGDGDRLEVVHFVGGG